MAEPQEMLPLAEMSNDFFMTVIWRSDSKPRDVVNLTLVDSKSICSFAKHFNMFDKLQNCLKHTQKNCPKRGNRDVKKRRRRTPSNGIWCGILFSIDDLVDSLLIVRTINLSSGCLCLLLVYVFPGALQALGCLCRHSPPGPQGNWSECSQVVMAERNISSR